MILGLIPKTFNFLDLPLSIFLRKWSLILVLLFFNSCFQGNNPGNSPNFSGTSSNAGKAIIPENPNPGIPSEVLKIAHYVLQNGRPMEGYVGGRKFGNYEKRLPEIGANGSPIYYQEWDVYPHIHGKNRGTDRIITSNEGKAYYTHDHYQTFTPLALP